MPISWPRKFAKEGASVGRLLAEHSNLEIDLMNCVQMGRGGDLNTVLKAMFGKRGGTRRIDEAEKLGTPAFVRLGLGHDFGMIIRVLRNCLEIRNQYAHWIWWDDGTGKLAFANLEELAKHKKVINDLRKLRAFHVDPALLAEQEAYFYYADQYLVWINYEGRVRSKVLDQHTFVRPKPIRRPALWLP